MPVQIWLMNRLRTDLGNESRRIHGKLRTIFPWQKCASLFAAARMLRSRDVFLLEDLWRLLGKLCVLREARVCHLPFRVLGNLRGEVEIVDVPTLES